VVCIAALTTALVAGKISDAAAAAIIGPIVAFWFMSGSANRFSLLNPTTEKQTLPPAPVTQVESITPTIPTGGLKP
jgi:hypothetical protein